MYDRINLPDSIDEYVARGIKKGRKLKKRQLFKRTTGAMISIILVIFVFGIRVSPVFAANVAKIPGLKYIVELISLDKGLTSAVDNNYIQNINQSLEKNGIKFTVRDIIADNSGIIIFYNLDNKTDFVHPYFQDLKLLDESRNELKMSSSYGLGGSSKNFDGKLEFYVVNENNELGVNPQNNITQSDELPDKVILQFKISVDVPKNNAELEPVKDNKGFSEPQNNSKALDGIYEFPITIDKSKFSSMEKVYKIGRSVEIEGQKIYFDEIKTYPIKSILSISFDKSNSMRIFSFDDLKLIDETGQEWGRITNGMSGSYPGEESQKLNFQSNYFNKPKKLYITGSSAQALDKEKCFFTLDIKNKKIISPYDLLTLTDLSLEKDKLFFEANIKKDISDIHRSYQISNEAVDANGNKLEIVSEGMSSGEQISGMDYSIKLSKDFKGPITFKINGYPTRIKGGFKVEIPLED